MSSGSSKDREGFVRQARLKECDELYMVQLVGYAGRILG
jgi:hypothetical protein